MKNFEKYITLNFLSFLGLICLVLSLIVIFYLYPDITAYDKTSGEDAPYGIFGLMSFSAVFLFINTLIELAVLPCVFIEFLIYKFKNTEPKFVKITDKLKKIHFIVFILGLIVSIISLIFGLLYIFSPI